MKYRALNKQDIERVHSFICQMTDIYGKGVERSDCIDEGWLGFMKALNSYESYYLKYEFEEFAFLCVAKQIQKARKQSNDIFRFERYIIDNISPLEIAKFDIFQFVERREQFETLEEIEKQVAKDYIFGFKAYEIMHRHRLSQKNLDRIGENICRKLNIC